MVQFTNPLHGLRFHELMRDGGYKSRIRIYSIDLAIDPIDVSNQAEVETYGTLMQYDPTDTDSNGRIAQNGIRIDNYYNKDEQYTIGNANMCSIRIPLINDDGYFSTYDWEQTVIIYWDVWDPLNSIWITCPLGVYWWERPTKTSAVVVNARANDGMYLLGQMDYVWPDFSGGKKLGDIYESIISTIAGLIVYSDWRLWPNMNAITYNSEPFDVTNMTRREVLAKLAEIAGANAFISRSGVVMLKPFTNASWTTIPGAPPTYYIIDGDSGPTPIMNIDIGEYTVPLIDKFIAQVGQTGQVYTIGTGGNKMYSFNNGFLGISSEDAQTMVQNMYWSASGQYGRSNMVAYVPIAITAYADPSVEAGDVIRVIRGGTTYLMPVFQQTLKWNGTYWIVEMQNSGYEKRALPSEASRKSYVEAETNSQSADRLENVELRTYNLENRFFDSGTITAQSVNANSTYTLNITFGVDFMVAPNVLASIAADSSSNIGKCSVSVTNVTQTGFTLVIHNGDSAAHTLGASWFAIENMRNSNVVGYGAVGIMIVE